MKIKFVVVGKTAESYLKEGEKIYEKRIKRYNPFDYVMINDVKNAAKLSKSELKKKEAVLILNEIKSADFVVLLDERGKNFTSVQFSENIQNLMLRSLKTVVFVVGGAYGFDENVYQRANQKMQLSSMTFSHQMVRLIFLEQLYRAFSILKNEPYHH